MANRVEKSKISELLNTKRKSFKTTELVEGKYYIGKLTSDQLYIYQNITKDKKPRYTSQELGYIHINNKNFCSGNIGFNSNFSEHYEATEEEIELLKESQKNNKYTELVIAQYIIKTTIGNDYIAAIDKQGKVSWTEEIEGVLKYLKDDLKITYKGSVNYKPKTLKELKELVNNTPIKIDSISKERT